MKQRKRPQTRIGRVMSELYVGSLVVGVVVVLAGVVALVVSFGMQVSRWVALAD